MATGATKWGDPKRFPWTSPANPIYQNEARILARFILKQRPDAKIGVLYQNDGLGKDNLEAVVATEKELGGIKPGKTPVAYEKLVDRTVWKDAKALAGK